MIFSKRRQKALLWSTGLICNLAANCIDPDYIPRYVASRFCLMSRTFANENFVGSINER